MRSFPKILIKDGTAYFAPFNSTQVTTAEQIEGKQTQGRFYSQYTFEKARFSDQVMPTLTLA